MSFKGLCKKIKILPLLTIQTIAAAAATILATTAWFTNISNFKPDNVTSSVITSYFDSGSGASTDPFVITRPVHYWNLVGLQDNNEMTVTINGIETPFADAELYFQFGKKNADGIVGNDDDDIYLFYKYDNNGVLQFTDSSETVEETSPYLNMNYYQGDNSIQPLGSSNHPFKGHVRGNNLTVSNLHIAGHGKTDIGIFGYVAEGATVKNIYFESPRIDTQVPDITENSPSNHNAHASHSYIGYIAGHVYNAKASFDHVYVNNCQLYNSVGNQNEMINQYGYFGHSDIPFEITGTTSSYSTELSPSAAYNAIDSSYPSGSSQNLAARNVGYTPTGLYGEAMTSSTDHYTMNNNNNTHSLSTIGYSAGESMSKHVRYFDQYDNNDLKRLPTSVKEISAVPSSWDNYDDGDYLYWDTTNKKWQYTSVTSNIDPDQQQVTYNIFTISYTYSGTKYYLYYDNGNLSVSTNIPTTSDDNYWFVLKTSFGSSGVANLDDNSDTGSYYIYSPANQAYLYAKAVSSGYGDPTFVTDTSQATLFTMKGPQTPIQYSDNECALMGSDKVIYKKTSSLDQITAYDIGDVQTRYSDEGSEYHVVTQTSDIEEGDTIIFGSTYNAADETIGGWVMSTAQNSNNRGSVEATITNGVFLNVPGMAKFVVHIETIDSANYYSFYDSSNNGYIYAAGTATTKTNWLRTQESLDDNGRWSLNFAADSTSTGDSTYAVQITSKGNTKTPRLRFNYLKANGFYLFSCYDPDNNNWPQQRNPVLYKRITTSGVQEHYTNAEQKTYTSSTSAEKIIHTYDLLTASTTVDNPDNPTYYNANDPFDVERTSSVEVIWNISGSKVTYTAALKQGWYKVTNVSDLSTGDQIVIASSEEDYAMSTTESDVDTRDSVAITKSSDSLGDTITWAEDANVQIIELKAGSTSNSYGLYTGSEGYLYALEGTSDDDYGIGTKTALDASSSWTISFTNGNAIITSQVNSDYNVLDYDTYKNSENTYFCVYSSEYTLGAVSIYKYYDEERENAIYISDSIGDRYDSDVIDVLGEANFYNDYISLAGTANSCATIPETAVNSSTNFYTTTYNTNAIVLTIENTGSRDLGTLVYSYNSDSTGEPVTLSGNGTYNTLEFSGVRDIDETEAHSYLLNINSYNIQSLAMCALDENGYICATFNKDGEVVYPSDFDNSIIKKYVIVIGGTSGILNITDVKFTYTKAEGNTGDFGCIDYRSAYYDDQGNFLSEVSQVSHTIINFYYNVPKEGQIVHAELTYNAATSTYTLTFTSNVACTINVFNYDANNYNLIVNGTQYYEGTNIIAISAT